jgi:hypothetical protein
MSEGSDLDWMLRANLAPKGKRPEFFGDPDKEKLLSMVLALTGELAVMRLRLDTVERLLEEKNVLSAEAVERFEPDRAAGQERGEWLREYVSRIMRGPQQQMEAMMREGDRPLDEVSAELRDS